MTNPDLLSSTSKPCKRTCILDIETNGIDKATLIHCIVMKDIHTNELFKFYPNSPLGGHLDWQDTFKKFVEEECETFIGHNIVAFDSYMIKRFTGIEIKVKDCIDTLVLSRLFRPVSPFKEVAAKFGIDDRVGGHSLGAWGSRLKFPKTDFHAFDKFTMEMLEYCVQDVEVTHKVYNTLMKESEGFSRTSIRLEHVVADLLAQQERNGFYLDKTACLALQKETKDLLDESDRQLQKLFPPQFKKYDVHTTKHTKDGELSKVTEKVIGRHLGSPTLDAVLRDDGNYDLLTLEVFNPQSSTQIGERLLNIGWNPSKFTATGKPKTDKDTLLGAIETLLQENPERDELKCLANYNIIADRHQKATKWLELVREDGRVHGQINPIGAGTHRCSHFNDNMANIAKVQPYKGSILELQKYDIPSLKKFDKVLDNKVFIEAKGDSYEAILTGLEGKFGWDSRNCWAASSPDMCIVGADASGIQLRALAHYMNDPAYTSALLEGDIHTVNQHAAGIDTRNKAKTFIYAWLLGGGDEKIGQIVGVSEDEYEELFELAKHHEVYPHNSLKLFNKVVNGLRKIGRKADRKTVATIIKGFYTKDKFLERTPALKRLKKEDIPEATRRGYLIGIDGRKLWIPNEHLAMSMYLQGFEAVAMKAAICFFSADLKKKGVPFKQCAFVHDEVQIETPWECAEEVGTSIVNGIKKAGEYFNSNCPLDGEYKVGRSWAFTH